MTQRFYLHAKDPGRVLVRANLHAFIDRLPDDKPWLITVEPHRKTRTGKQRRALWSAAYGPVMEFIGLEGAEDKRELHRYFCGAYFGTKLDVLGREVPIRTTTRNERGERDEIDTIEALAFYAFIQRKAAEQGVDVPDPDPFWRENAQRELERIAEREFEDEG